MDGCCDLKGLALVMVQFTFYQDPKFICASFFFFFDFRGFNFRKNLPLQICEYTVNVYSAILVLKKVDVYILYMVYILIWCTSWYRVHYAYRVYHAYRVHIMYRVYLVYHLLLYTETLRNVISHRIYCLWYWHQ